MIAQELQEVAPYMVTTTESVLDDGSPGFLTIDNSAMTYMLINAMKELNQENFVLKSDQAAIKVELAAMKNILNTLLQQNSVAGQVLSTEK